MSKDYSSDNIIILVECLHEQAVSLGLENMSVIVEPYPLIRAGIMTEPKLNTASIIISDRALNVLSAEAFKFLINHELGHYDFKNKSLDDPEKEMTDRRSFLSKGHNRINLMLNSGTALGAALLTADFAFGIPLKIAGAYLTYHSMKELFLNNKAHRKIEDYCDEYALEKAGYNVDGARELFNALKAQRKGAKKLIEDFIDQNPKLQPKEELNRDGGIKLKFKERLILTESKFSPKSLIVDRIMPQYRDHEKRISRLERLALEQQKGSSEIAK
jgi:Zn-dependent protease with chaperone function